jgi:hypothetical protein
MSPGALLRTLRGNRGAVFVITIGVMTAILIVAAYVIDEGIWFVHRQHLQTEADAAALASAHDFQYPCTPYGTMDQTIEDAVHQYDGTTVASGGYNPQVAGEGAGTEAVPGPSNPPLSAYSNTAHNLFSVVNRPNFFNQSFPNDSGLSGTANTDGSPCADAAIDVKLSETNVPSIFNFGNPAYINAQARISIEKLTSASGAEPFVEPLPAQLPSSMTATLVDESNNDSTVAGPITLNDSSANLTSFNGTFTSVAFPTLSAGTTGAAHAIGLRICYAGGSCYESGSTSPGVTYTRVWADSTSSSAPPQVGNITVMPDPNGSPACSNADGAASMTNFISTGTTCTVVVQASGITLPSDSGGSCGDASFGLTAGSLSAASTQNGQCTWTSGPISVSESSGLSNVTLYWQLTNGTIPTGASGGSNGKCGTGKNACTGNLGVVQRINSGAFTSTDTSTSGSGSIIGVALTDPNGNQVMSIQSGSPAENIGVNVTVLGFQESSSISNPPIELSFGGNQQNAAINCNGSEGSPQFQQALVTGCTTVYQTQPAPGSCPPPPSIVQPPPACAQENPGNGKLANDLAAAMDCKINGSGQVDNNGKCAGGTPTTCVNPNRWVSPNSISQILSQSPADPRLLILLITNNGALINGAASVPVLAFASFYVTGWSATTSGSEKASDPCIGITGGTSPNGLAYTSDTNPGPNAPPGILMGHFVQYTVPPGPGETGSGTCTQGTFTDCIPVLTK